MKDVSKDNKNSVFGYSGSPLRTGMVKVFNGSGEFQRELVSPHPHTDDRFGVGRNPINDDGTLCAVSTHISEDENNYGGISVYNIDTGAIKFTIDPLTVNGTMGMYMDITGSEDDGYLIFQSYNYSDDATSGSGSVEHSNENRIYIYKISDGQEIARVVLPVEFDWEDYPVSIQGDEASGATIVISFLGIDPGFAVILCMSAEGVIDTSPIQQLVTHFGSK